MRRRKFSAPGNEVFCRDESDFPEYLAVVNNKQFDYHTVKGCMELKEGMRYGSSKSTRKTGSAKYIFSSAAEQSTGI